MCIALAFYLWNSSLLHSSCTRLIGLEHPILPDIVSVPEHYSNQPSGFRMGQLHLGRDDCAANRGGGQSSVSARRGKGSRVVRMWPMNQHRA